MGIVRDLRHGADGALEVVITPPTAAARPWSRSIGDIVARLAREGLAARVVTQLAPAWTTDWMTPVAHEKLRAYGIAPPQCSSAQAGGRR